MTSFFPPRQSDPPDVAPSRQTHKYDPSSGQIPGVLGVPVAIPGATIQTKMLEIAMDIFVVYREGFLATVRVITRPGATFPTPIEESIPGSRMRLGLEFSDGRRGYATNRQVPASDLSSFAMVLQGGGGTRVALDYDLWVYATPPRGPMQLFVEWTAAGLEESSLEIDATPIADAVSRVKDTWPTE